MQNSKNNLNFLFEFTELINSKETVEDRKSTFNNSGHVSRSLSLVMK